MKMQKGEITPAKVRATAMDLLTGREFSRAELGKNKYGRTSRFGSALRPVQIQPVTGIKKIESTLVFQSILSFFVL